MRKLGQIFVDLGYITDDQLEMLVEEQNQNSNSLIGQVAIDMGYIDEDKLTISLCEQFNLQRIEIDGLKPNESLDFVPKAMIQLYEIIPIAVKDDVLTIITYKPQMLHTLDELRQFLGMEIRQLVANKSDVQRFIAKYYDDTVDTFDSILQELEEDKSASSLLKDGRIEIGDLEQLSQSRPIRRLLNMVILTAIKEQASDIHFEPFENEFKIRINSQGTLSEMIPPPRHFANPIIARIKVMANLDISERRMPQDGRIDLQVGGHNVDIRVSVLPTINGESVVLRLLDKSTQSLDIERIGMPKKTLEKFRSLMKSPNGIILVTGPTGSGKTTTLYSALSELNTKERKIITIEDPVEYDIDGIVQIPVDEDVDVTFSKAMRAILRQDPDVILIGEIRDLETAEIAIKASLTGHLVFGTLHTNDSASTVTRLRDMGIADFLVSSTIEAVLAQRLVRTICPNCKTEDKFSDADLTKFPALKKYKAYKGEGCLTCKGTGFKGRKGIYELLLVDDVIRDMITSRKPSDEIRKQAKKNGMVTLLESGLRSVVRGETTLNEVLKQAVVEN